MQRFLLTVPLACTLWGGCVADDPVDPILDAEVAAELALATDAYTRYQDMATPDHQVTITTKVIATSLVENETLESLLAALPPATHLVPYVVSIDRDHRGAYHTGLKPQFRTWGDGGYPTRGDFGLGDGQPAAVGTPVPEPTVSPTPMPTVSPTPMPTASPTPMPTASPTPMPTASPTPSPTPCACATLGSPSSSSARVVNEFPHDSPASLFFDRPLATTPMIAFTAVSVTVTIDGQTQVHPAFVAHFGDGLPVLLDEVLLGVNNFVVHAAEDRPRAAPVFSNVEGSWTAQADGCKKFNANDGDRLTWGVYNCFGLNHLFDVWVEASVNASMTCARYTKADGGFGCKVASYSGVPKATGQGGSWCFTSYYVTSDTAQAKDPISENGIRVGVDFSIGASSHLVNTSTSKVDVKLEGKATGEKAEGNGSVHVEIDNPGGSYGGVDLTIDGEIICPDHAP
ncbi:MAG: hypothetical protein R3B06_26180 [Kofleriaceae bacterium]